MKIQVPSIPEEGQTLSLSSEEAWVRDMLKNRFPDFCPGEPHSSGKLQLFRTDANVTARGHMKWALSPACDRCGESFQKEMDFRFLRHLTPYFSHPDNERKGQGEEVELEEEDLDFGTYHGEEIDLSHLVAEEILLSLPMRFLCREDCKGLCPRCGVNLNRESCSCRPAAEEASPFASLKNFKVKAGKK